jgi:hypothetical protein
MRRMTARVALVLVVMLATFAAAHTVLGARGQLSRSGLAPGTRQSRAPALTGQCKVSKVSYATGEDTGNSTTSTSYVDVPGMSSTFTEGGTVTRCVTVEYTAFVFAAEGDNLMFVRALLDGVTVASPSETQFDGDSDEDGDFQWARSHAFNFVFPSVAPGSHTIKIQWRSLDGGTIFTHRRTLLVGHA